jgi:hypothetical protein
MDLKESGVFLEKIFLISNDLVSLDAVAEAEPLLHLFFSKLLANFP